MRGLGAAPVAQRSGQSHASPPIGRHRLMIWKRRASSTGTSAAGRCRRTRAAVESGVCLMCTWDTGWHFWEVLSSPRGRLRRIAGVTDREGAREGKVWVIRCSEWSGEGGAQREDLLWSKSATRDAPVGSFTSTMLWA